MRPLEGLSERESDCPQQDPNFTGKIECSEETHTELFLLRGGLCKLNFINKNTFNKRGALEAR